MRAPLPMHWTQITQLLILLMTANGTPVIAQKIFGNIWSYPLDGEKVWPDGRPVFGPSKTVRGVACAVVLTTVVAFMLGLTWMLGLLAGALAMIGDLLSSFTKRRLGLPASAQATGLDQVPESLLPALACAHELDLGWIDIITATAIFFIGEIVLSRLLFALNIRRRPY
jgi:CDP-2,3-bis-(O-geranylgeranyl)-sn-glycerol synthase